MKNIYRCTYNPAIYPDETWFFEENDIHDLLVHRHYGDDVNVKWDATNNILSIIRITVPLDYEFQSGKYS